MQRAASLRSDELHPGDLIAGKYRVRTILGRSHGLLVEAFHTDFDQRVIIKILLPGSVDEVEIERFRREARTLAKLESEHVARIIDVGHQQDGSFYLVRQYLEGTDLATHMRRSGPLRIQEAVLFVLQAAEAVAETHSHGIILRELQPSHLFLTTRAGGAPLIKVIDFGTAKLMRDAAAPGAGGELTATTMFGMSPYSSPELVRKAKNVDSRTDVWSLGAILYELLCGRPPFSGEMAMLMLQITKEDPTPVSQLVGGLPPEIDQILAWCLAKDIDGRFMNVHAFAHALTPFASPEGLVLIERIGQITQAAKQRKKTGSVPPPAPRAAPPPRNIAQEDSVTGVGANAAPDEPLERTIFMGDFSAAAPASAARPTAPPRSSGGGPVFAGAAAGAVPAFPVVPPPPGSRPGVSDPGSGLLGPSPQFDVQQKPTWQGRDNGMRPDSATPPSTVLGARSAVSTGAHQAVVSAAEKTTLNRKLTIGALGAVAVFLPVLAVVLIVRSRPADPPSVVVPDSSGLITVPAPAQAPTIAEVTPPPEPTVAPIAAPTVAPTAEPVAALAPTPAPTPPPAKTSSGGSTSGGSTPKTATPPAPTPPAPTAAAASGSTGMLVAVAVGGSCAFSVNGASKGTTSTLKLPLKPGNYSVSCKPATGATKSRSVTIKSGETAMAMFKLQ